LAVQSFSTLSDSFAALGDATRLAILSRLASEGDMSVQEIARPFAMSLAAVSQHLKVLERAGLIGRKRDGQKRPCHLNAERLAETARWFDHTRAAWEARLDRLEGFLAQEQSLQPPIPAATVPKGEDNEP
jgi:DNA-binding transcriptional ArsR family regulator